MGNKGASLKTEPRILNKAGVRVTNQRSLILDIIRRGRGHLDADEVYRQARQRHPSISLSTVYRNLRLLKELGLVDELHFDETHHHYEVKPSAEHHHLVCLGCGKVIEFQCPLSQHVKDSIAEVESFEIVSTEVRMAGYCPKCRQEKKEHGG